jgi:hypothetical protein
LTRRLCGQYKTPDADQSYGVHFFAGEADALEGFSKRESHARGLPAKSKKRKSERKYREEIERHLAEHVLKASNLP